VRNDVGLNYRRGEEMRRFKMFLEIYMSTHWLDVDNINLRMRRRGKIGSVYYAFS
jgi:hypothetical protein